jgi:hypothetical protein
MRRSIAIVAAGLAVAGCGEAAVEQPPPVNPAQASAAPPPGVDRAGLRRERQITGMLNGAMRATVRSNPRCEVRPPDREGTFTDAAPSAELHAAFAILRRPQTERERIPDGQVGVPGDTVYRSAYRIATSASGRQYLLVATQSANRFTPRPPECADAVRSHFDAQLAGRGARFVREARKALDQIIRDEWTGSPGVMLPFEGLYLFEYGDGAVGGGGGGGSLASLREHAPTTSTGDDRTSIVSGLVPDGVAAAELTFPRVVSRGRYRPPTRYARKITVTAPVRDNVISVRVPRPPQDATAATTMWKGPDGEPVEVFRREP